MLGKLFKYELKATARLFLPLYLALLALALLLNPGVAYNNMDAAPSDTLGVIFVLGTVVYGLLIAAIFTLTMVITVQRYYKNIFGDEGYLTLTLPASPWQHITAKMLVSCLWVIVSFIVTALSGMIMALSADGFRMFWNAMGQFFSELTTLSALQWFVVAEMFIFIITGLLVIELLAYLSISLASLVQRFRILLSFGIFVGLCNLISLVLSVGGDWINIDISLPNTEGAITQMMSIVLLMGILINVIIGAGCFVGSAQILKKHLNLD